jgi:hypothetical protein
VSRRPPGTWLLEVLEHRLAKAHGLDVSQGSVPEGREIGLARSGRHGRDDLIQIEIGQAVGRLDDLRLHGLLQGPEQDAGPGHGVLTAPSGLVRRRWRSDKRPENVTPIDQTRQATRLVQHDQTLHPVLHHQPDRLVK